MKRKLIIILSIVAVILIALGAIFAKNFYYYNVSNFSSKDGESHSYHIYPEASTDSVISVIREHYEMASQIAWDLHCQHLKFTQTKPGYYRFSDEISNRELIRRLQLGEQTPIKLSFTQSIRTREQLAGFMGKKLLLDSIDIKSRLDSKEYMEHYGLTPETAECLFIPNTYEVYWTLSPDQLFERMHKEYKRFWNNDRLSKAAQLGLTPTEVVTLASIIS